MSIELAIHDRNDTLQENDDNIKLLIEKVEQRLHFLSAKRLQSAIDFISYLYERECWEATAELETIPGFMEGFERAKEQIINNDVVRFEDIQQDV